MTRLHTFLASSLLCLGVSACGDASLLVPQAPRPNGSTIGSNNRTESDTSATTERGTHTVGSGSRVVGTATEEPTTERGGYGIGSGNRTETTDTAERAGPTIGSGSRTESATTETTERGGGGFGSGNRTETTTTSITTERNGYGFGSGN